MLENTEYYYSIRLHEQVVCFFVVSIMFTGTGLKTSDLEEENKLNYSYTLEDYCIHEEDVVFEYQFTLMVRERLGKRTIDGEEW